LREKASAMAMVSDESLVKAASTVATVSGPALPAAAF
jgi:hypothetical protein